MSNTGYTGISLRNDGYYDVHVGQAQSYPGGPHGRSSRFAKLSDAIGFYGAQSLSPFDHPQFIDVFGIAPDILSQITSLTDEQKAERKTAADTREEWYATVVLGVHPNGTIQFYVDLAHGSIWKERTSKMMGDGFHAIPLWQFGPFIKDIAKQHEDAFKVVLQQDSDLVQRASECFERIFK
jgi:hypothetical protein